jgi:flagellar basal-body rod modification protein FlgD
MSVIDTALSKSSLLGNTTNSKTGGGVQSLGINDFITLMTTQLKYQDPTKPQDSTAFVAQLAQFSTVSGVQEMNTNMTSLVNQLKGNAALNATSLVGHQVLVQADTLAYTSGNTVNGSVATPDGATSLTIGVYDKAGSLVRQFTAPATTGLSTFTWDGLNDSGKAVASGNYTFKAIGDVSGTSVSATTLLSTKVDSVTLDTSDGSMALNTDGIGSVQLADVWKVY